MVVEVVVGVAGAGLRSTSKGSDGVNDRRTITATTVGILLCSMMLLHGCNSTNQPVVVGLTNKYNNDNNDTWMTLPFPPPLLIPAL